MALRGRLTFIWILLSVQEMPVCSESQSVEASMATVRFLGAVGAEQVHTAKKKVKVGELRVALYSVCTCYT